MKGTPKRAERGAKKSVDTVEFDLEERPSPIAPPKEAPASLEEVREEVEAESAQPEAQGSLGSGKKLVAKKAEEVIEAKNVFPKHFFTSYQAMNTGVESKAPKPAEVLPYV